MADTMPFGMAIAPGHEDAFQLAARPKLAAPKPVPPDAAKLRWLEAVGRDNLQIAELRADNEQLRADRQRARSDLDHAISQREEARELARQAHALAEQIAAERDDLARQLAAASAPLRQRVWLYTGWLLAAAGWTVAAWQVIG